MIIRFLAHAKSELTDAVAYYDGELSGLVIDVDTNVVREQAIWILAVAHAHKPSRILDRSPEGHRLAAERTPWRPGTCGSFVGLRSASSCSVVTNATDAM